MKTSDRGGEECSNSAPAGVHLYMLKTSDILRREIIIEQQGEGGRQGERYDSSSISFSVFVIIILATPLLSAPSV